MTRGGLLGCAALDAPDDAVVEGPAGGDGAVSRSRDVRSLFELGSFEDGEVLVAASTDPDWEPVLKRASAVVTDRGGRTCHAAIVARELGLPAVVGTGEATRVLEDGREVTVTCAEPVKPPKLAFTVALAESVKGVV